MTKEQKLKRLVDQIPDIAGAHVVFKRGHGYYVYSGSDAPLYFQRFEIGEKFLSEWIVKRRQPSLSRLRVGVRKMLPLTFDEGAAWYPGRAS